jgi:hypothetical protein
MHAFIDQARSNVRRLTATKLGERWIGLPLQAADCVPLTLAVSNE